MVICKSFSSAKSKSNTGIFLALLSWFTRQRHQGNIERATLETWSHLYGFKPRNLGEPEKSAHADDIHSPKLQGLKMRKVTTDAASTNRRRALGAGTVDEASVFARPTASDVSSGPGRKTQSKSTSRPRPSWALRPITSDVPSCPAPQAGEASQGREGSSARPGRCGAELASV